jgi:hypothetical protein
VRPVSFGHFGYMGETCELCLILATGVGPVSSIWSGYRVETCKPVALGYSWVTGGSPGEKLYSPHHQVCIEYPILSLKFQSKLNVVPQLLKGSM